MLVAAFLLPATIIAKDQPLKYTPYKIKGTVTMTLPEGWDSLPLGTPIPVVEAIDIGEAPRFGRYYNEVTAGTLTIFLIDDELVFFLVAEGACTAASGDTAYWSMVGPEITFLYGEGRLEGEQGGFTMTSVSEPEPLSSTVLKFSYTGEGTIAFVK